MKGAHAGRSQDLRSLFVWHGFRIQHGSRICHWNKPRLFIPPHIASRRGETIENTDVGLSRRASPRSRRNLP
jgi:hypothetical protein